MAVGAVVGFAVGAAVGLAVAAGFGVAVADGLEVGFAVGAAVGLVVGFAVAAGFGVAVAEGFAVALLPEDGLLAVLPPALGFVVAEGFAVALLPEDGLLVVLPPALGFVVALGFDAVLLSVLDAVEELLSFELSVLLLLSVFVPGVAVGFALAVLELAVGLLLAANALLLSCSFSDTELLTVLDVSVAGSSLPPRDGSAAACRAQHQSRRQHGSRDLRFHVKSTLSRCI